MNDNDIDNDIDNDNDDGNDVVAAVDRRLSDKLRRALGLMLEEDIESALDWQNLNFANLDRVPRQDRGYLNHGQREWSVPFAYTHRRVPCAPQPRDPNGSISRVNSAQFSHSKRPVSRRTAAKTRYLTRRWTHKSACSCIVVNENADTTNCAASRLRKSRRWMRTRKHPKPPKRHLVPQRPSTAPGSTIRWHPGSRIHSSHRHVSLIPVRSARNNKYHVDDSASISSGGRNNISDNNTNGGNMRDCAHRTEYEGIAPANSARNRNAANRGRVSRSHHHHHHHHHHRHRRRRHELNRADFRSSALVVRRMATGDNRRVSAILSSPQHGADVTNVSMNSLMPSFGDRVAIARSVGRYAMHKPSIHRPVVTSLPRPIGVTSAKSHHRLTQWLNSQYDRSRRINLSAPETTSHMVELRERAQPGPSRYRRDRLFDKFTPEEGRAFTFSRVPREAWRPQS